MSDYFPREIWVEILHGQTIKSLVKCTAVCKAWKSLITDHSFVSDHITRTIQASHGNGSLFLHLYHRKRDEQYCFYQEIYSPYSDNEQIDLLSISKFPLSRLFVSYKYPPVVGTCNGLVCFVDDTGTHVANLVTWNPSIRKYVVIPVPRVIFNDVNRVRYQTSFGFGFDSRTKDFKVVRLITTLSKREATPQVEVFSLATGSWRSVTGTSTPFHLSPYVSWTANIFINGALHWVVKNRSNGGIYNFILTFDVGEETFGELILPQCLRESPFEVSILAGGDSVAVVHISYSVSERKFFSIWVMKEYGVVESWTEVFHSDSRRYGGISRPLALRSSGEVVIQIRSGAIISLDSMKNLVRNLGVRGACHAFVGYHVESLFLINKENDVLSY